MSERDEYLPTVQISNTAPAKYCNDCGRALPGVYYVKSTTADVRIVCEKCRP